MTWGSNPEADPPDVAGRVADVSVVALYLAFVVLALIGTVQRSCDDGHWQATSAYGYIAQ